MEVENLCTLFRKKYTRDETEYFRGVSKLESPIMKNR
jgi:hypothetical protein